MTLRRRLILQITATVLAIALLSIVAIAGVRGLRQNFTLALVANAQLRDSYTAGAYVALAKAELGRSPQTLDTTLRATRALQSAEQILADGEPSASRLPNTQPQFFHVQQSIHKSLTTINRPNGFDPTMAEPMNALVELSAATRRTIERAQADADQNHRTIERSVISIAIAATLAIIAIGWRQYRSVIRPLTSLQRAVRRLASGNLDERIAHAGDREFATLADEFNRMAVELRRVQRDLESRVDEKSRALIQSDRLASVGYLAAGVAHEINNPLSIIAGYGERSLRKLQARSDDQSLADTLQQSIRVMCDEAFRCKQITDRLLQLARPGDSSKRVVSLADAVREAIVPLAGLKQFASRQIRVDVEADPNDCQVLANEGELRQMLLNLLINALEACSDQSAPMIRVGVRRTGAMVELSVADNGRGMSAETVARVFEPFFTKGNAANSVRDVVRSIGSGLGLSIVHAIVADHSGTIEARSDGPDRGKRVCRSLPARRNGPDRIRRD